MRGKEKNYRKNKKEWFGRKSKDSWYKKRY